MPIILGIDPGSRITGYGVIASEGNRHRYIASGCIKTNADTMAERLHQVYSGISDIITQYRPVESGVEEVFLNKNVNSALKLGQARGAALVAIAAQSVAVAEYTPRKIKQAVVGYGGAEKHQVQHMIKLLLNLSELPQQDAADALAVALCHAHSRGVIGYKSYEVVA
ncbi:MAG: crossover junction endodeoxyribonuclease RuvC [Pseudomonadota bacterium]|nr:crossover junction endodeoxyribonuclease RuvC [Pseudomonadota bacterium]